MVYLTTLWIVKPWGDFPLNDDWVYARDCLFSARDGRLSLTRFESAWAFPQIIFGTFVARCYGFSHALFRTSGILALAGIVLVGDLYLRRLGLPWSDRLMIAAVYVFHPVTYLLSLSFMTDLPFLVFWVGACYGWDQALVTGKRSWFSFATFASVVAMAQRQLGLFIPAAAFLILFFPWKSSPSGLVAPVPWRESRHELRNRAVPYLGVTLCWFAIFSVWWRWMDGYGAGLILPGPIEHYIVGAYRSATFLVVSSVPLLMILNRPASGTQINKLMFTVSAFYIFIATLCLTAGQSPLFFGNLLSKCGLFNENEVLLGRRPTIFGPNFNRFVCVLGIGGLVLAFPRLATFGCSTGRKSSCDKTSNAPKVDGSETMPEGFGSVLMVASLIYFGFFMLRGMYFDRYLLPVLAAVYLSLAKSGPRNSRALRIVAGAWISIVAAISVTLASDYFRWNEARWAAAESLERQGIRAGLIHAGYEWNGWRVAHKPFPSTNVLEYEYIVAFSPDFHSFEIVEAIPWKSIWPPRDRKMYILKRIRPPLHS